LHRLRIKWPSVIAFTVSFPWIPIEIDKDEDIPPSHTTPLFICGLIAVFLREDDAFPAGVGFFVIRGEAAPFELPESVSNDLRPNRTPSMARFEYLHKRIPIAENISSFPLQILFELYPVPDEEFQKPVVTLPNRFGMLS
jgi:hypothetical protein